ncbi:MULTISPECIES: hypothetical protein [Bacillaceae]|uniref:Uncharacterized protein n=1 Tax=Evansella alkalicola TaxID=745819 RepID=A0ABS6JSL7_9BACI|nr:MULTISPECIES: hypothetical protein [Bacillaceae]MBU9721237.1 hypothetical protein [Bacillus alkalicola]
MKAKIVFFLLTMVVLHGLVLFISSTIPLYHWTDLATTISIVAFGIIFFFSLQGDAASWQVDMEEKTFNDSSHTFKHEALGIIFNPILLGSGIYLLVSFSFPYFFH